MGWLDDFANSQKAKRVVFANYLDHLRMKNEAEGHHSGRYGSVEDALQDFAQRTGLTEMQKRGLRRQMFIKMAVDFTKPDSSEKDMIGSGEAPVSIVPGVSPGTDKKKLLRKLKKKKMMEELDNPEQIANRDLEDRAPDESPGSGDTGQLVDPAMSVGGYEPWRVVFAVDEEKSTSPFSKHKAPSKEQRTYKFKSQRPRGTGITTSREGKILEKIRALQEQIVGHFMEPGGTIASPKWKEGATEKERIELWKGRRRLDSEIEDLKAEYQYIQDRKQEKETLEKPRGRADQNNIKFLTALHTVLGVKGSKKRNKKLQELSDDGIQAKFDEALKKFKKKIYYKPSQGHDEEHGDYVKCMIDDWINPDDPSILPLEHITEHAEELLAEGASVDLWQEELIDEYLKQYPGASFFSRERELANFMERIADKALGTRLHPVHIATEAEKNQNYTDKVLINKILAKFRRYGVDPETATEGGQKSRKQLAEEVLEELKAQIDEEWPEVLTTEHIDKQTGEITHTTGQIGNLEEKGIPFDEFYSIFRDILNNTVEAHKGTLLRTKAPTRRPKIRWPSPAREERRQEWFKQLHKEDLIAELKAKLGRKPKKSEIINYLAKENLVGVRMSVTGQRGCWNCGQDHTVYVPNSKIGINSATCPNCNVYREVLIRSKSPDIGKKEQAGWKCPKEGCEQMHSYVIRDPNENDPGGAKTYIIYCDERYIDGGEKAVGPSKYIFPLTKEEMLVRTEIEEEAYEEGAEQVSAPLGVNDQVEHNTLGAGRIVFVEGRHIFANFPAHIETRPLKGIEGHVVKLAKKKDPNLPDWWKVVDVVIDNNTQTVAVSLRGPNGESNIKRYDNLKVLDAQVTIAHEVSLQDLQRLEFGSRRRRRIELLLKIGRVGCKGFEMYTVERYTKGRGKYKSKIRRKRKIKKPEAKIELLRNRVKRARTLRRLLGVS